MMLRVASVLGVLTVATFILACGLVRGRASADRLLRPVDGRWQRTQTKFALNEWRFYYEAQDPEFKRSAPILISANILGSLPRNIVIRFMKELPVRRAPLDGIPVSRDKAHSLSSPFWSAPYSFSLKSP